MIRVQHSRRRPLPPGVRYVGRPSRWGNPFKVGGCYALIGGKPTLDVPDGYYPFDKPAVEFHTAAEVVAAFREYAADRLSREPDWLDPLRGAAGLACYCKTTDVCHVDVLLALIAETAPAGIGCDEL